MYIPRCNDVPSSQSHLRIPPDSSEVCSLLCHWCHPINSAHLPHIYPAHILFPIFLCTFFITSTDVCYVILLIRHTCHIYKTSAVQDGKCLVTIEVKIGFGCKHYDENFPKTTHTPSHFQCWNLIDNFLTSPSTLGASDGEKKQRADRT